MAAQVTKAVLDADKHEDFLKHPSLQKGGVLLDKYKIIEVIGHGGFGCVFRVEETQGRTYAALKVRGFSI